MTDITRRQMIGRTAPWFAMLGMFGLGARIALDRPPIDPAFPDRVAVDHGNPYYDPYIDTRWLGVTLDGVDQKLCVEACQSEGWVRVLRTDNVGKLLVAREAVLTERRYGVVRFYRIGA